MANREKKKKMVLNVLPYISVISLFVGWQLVVTLDIIPNVLLASPIQVAKMFIYKLSHAQPDGFVLWVHTVVSLKEALLGYFLALVIGIPLGMLMGWFKPVEGLVGPIFEMLRPMPAIAWIPLTIFWFGIGLTGKVFIIFLSGLVACVINSYTGVKMTNPTLIRMARTYGATNWEIFFKICVPSSLPMVFGGLQVALAACWTTLVAAEMIAADSGLGFMITMGRRLIKTDLIMLGMVMVGLTGVVISVIIDKIETRLIAGVRR